MSERDDLLRFLDPWTLLLPEGGGRVLAAVGSGGKSQVLARLHRHYRSEGRSVLWTQTVPHPAPPDLERSSSGDPDESLTERLARYGSLFVAGEDDENGTPGSLTPEGIERLRRSLRPDVVLVEAHAPCGTPLRRDGVVPVWPLPVHLVLAVVGLQGVGRPWGPRSVAGEPSFPVVDGEPRRVRTEEARSQLSGPEGLLSQVPEGVPVLPFLCGFGAYRDVDGMFALVSELWERPGLRAVLLAELVGNARIDAAERLQAGDAPSGALHLDGERVYALYPARLDDLE